MPQPMLRLMPIGPYRMLLRAVVRMKESLFYRMLEPERLRVKLR